MCQQTRAHRRDKRNSPRVHCTTRDNVNITTSTIHSIFSSVYLVRSFNVLSLLYHHFWLRNPWRSLLYAPVTRTRIQSITTNTTTTHTTPTLYLHAHSPLVSLSLALIPDTQLFMCIFVRAFQHHSLIFTRNISRPSALSYLITCAHAVEKFRFAGALSLIAAL